MKFDHWAGKPRELSSLEQGWLPGSAHPLINGMVYCVHNLEDMEPPSPEHGGRRRRALIRSIGWGSSSRILPTQIRWIPKEWGCVKSNHASGTRTGSRKLPTIIAAMIFANSEAEREYRLPGFHDPHPESDGVSGAELGLTSFGLWSDTVKVEKPPSATTCAITFMDAGLVDTRRALHRVQLGRRR